MHGRWLMGLLCSPCGCQSCAKGVLGSPLLLGVKQRPGGAGWVKWARLQANRHPQGQWERKAINKLAPTPRTMLKIWGRARTIKPSAWHMRHTGCGRIQRRANLKWNGKNKSFSSWNTWDLLRVSYFLPGEKEVEKGKRYYRCLRDKWDHSRE